MKHVYYVSTFLLVFSVGLLGCASVNNTQKGAAVGAGAGAVVGGAIGKATGGTAKGALIGAAVGGTAGAIIGRQMDKQAAELEEELEGVEVERVGEGIQLTFDAAILFGFDSEALSPTARTNLDQLATSLQDYPGTDVLIIGHTDAVGSDAYNQGLSERRASAAGSYLLRQGLAAGRIETVGYGETQPVASNDTEFGRQQNRRVEVAIYASDDYVDSLQSD